MESKGNDPGRKTQQSHWDEAWSVSVKPRLPSRLNVGVLNVTRLLKRYVKPSCRYVEIGCAPGKLLVWVASELKANAVGLDYSEVGIRQCGALAKALKLEVDFHHEDIFRHSLNPKSFDVVTSFGVIEHFDNAAPIVKHHIDLVKPGGVALITIPNYGGIYGSIQSWCDAPNLAIHNLEIMTPDTLSALVNISSDIESVRAFAYGSINPWMLNLEKKLPRFIARFFSLSLNALGLLQPLTIDAIAPMLVLEVRKKP